MSLQAIILLLHVNVEVSQNSDSEQQFWPQVVFGELHTHSLFSQTLFPKQQTSPHNSGHVSHVNDPFVSLQYWFK